MAWSKQQLKKFRATMADRYGPTWAKDVQKRKVAKKNAKKSVVKDVTTVHLPLDAIPDKVRQPVRRGQRRNTSTTKQHDLKLIAALIVAVADLLNEGGV